MTLLDKDYTPVLMSMESYRQAIALEANVVGKALDTLKRFLPGLNDGFKERVSKFSQGTQPPLVELSKNQKKAFEVLRSVDYMTLSGFVVYTHEGFSGHLINIVPVLDKLLEDMNAVQKMILDYRVFLSGLISDRNARISLNDTFRKYKLKNKQRAELNSLVQEFYKANSVSSKKSFGDVFSRNSEAEGFIIQMGRIKHSMDAFPMKALRGDVDQCVTLLDIFNQRLQAGDVEDVSGEVSTSLSEMTYLIAQETEEIALNYHRLGIFVETANSVVETLAKINPND